MIEQGSLKDISAAELLLKGFAGDLTGVLYLKREEILKELYLRDGKLVWAVSNSDVDMLENILVSENKIDLQTISLIKSESKNPVELGKALVEKGILSFEEFVGYSKGQLERILTSVLKWGDGVYYFSKDVPAETYISLEINLKDFIHTFIKRNLDMGFVWTRIGSLQEELDKTPNESLIEKFDLSHEELELLDKFMGDLSIEMISLNFPGMAKEEILKTIYFFITAGLLVEKTSNIAESQGESFLISEKPDNDLNLFSERAISEDIEKIILDPPDEIQEPVKQFDRSDENEAYSADLGSGSAEIPQNSGISLSDQLLNEMKRDEGKKKGKLINFILILVLALFVIVGLIFLLMPPEDRPDLVSGTRAKEGITEISGEEKTPSGKHSENEETVEEKPVRVKKEDGTPVTEKKPELKKPQLEQKKDPIQTPPAGQSPGGVGPRVVFLEGRMAEAGNLWKKKILAQKKRYSVLLELDCMKSSVINAFNQARKSPDFFIINTERNGSVCYLVLMGIFPDKGSAETYMGKVPAYFWKQANPPKVIDLSVYL